MVRRYDDASGDVAALDDMSISIHAGEFLALMGPSGSGKSTLLHMIGAIDRPLSGQVLVEGVDLATLSQREAADYRNRRVGFVFQMLNLVPTLTAEENIWLPAAIAGVSRSDVRSRLSELLAEVGLGDKGGRYPQELSGGEQQRVAIARAVMMQPAVLLADEPTGSLDSASSDRVMAMLGKLHRKGQVIVLATHDPRVASAADRVIYLRDGRIDQELDPTGDAPAGDDGVSIARAAAP